LCDAIANITEDFSFAYLKEAFVATLLELARGEDDDGSDSEGEDDSEGDEDKDPLDKYEFWRTFKAQVKILRSEMGNDSDTLTGVGRRAGATLGTYEGISAAYEETVPLLDGMKLQGTRGQGQGPRRKAASHLAMVGVGGGSGASQDAGAVAVAVTGACGRGSGARGGGGGASAGAAKNRFAQAGSLPKPKHTFAPLARMKRTGSGEGVLEWGL
jgi:hypothetical protein